MREVTIINESGLYACIFRSERAEAKVFRKWVTSEVLPSIRKQGYYATKEALDLWAKNRIAYLENKAIHRDDAATQAALDHLKSEMDARRALEEEFLCGEIKKSEVKVRTKLVRTKAKALDTTLNHLLSRFKGTEWESDLTTTFFIEQALEEIKPLHHW
jgi:prophage antirepressor-like protein